MFSLALALACLAVKAVALQTISGCDRPPSCVDYVCSVYRNICPDDAERENVIKPLESKVFDLWRAGTKNLSLKITVRDFEICVALKNSLVLFMSVAGTSGVRLPHHLHGGDLPEDPGLWSGDAPQLLHPEWLEPAGLCHRHRRVRTHVRAGRRFGRTSVPGSLHRLCPRPLSAWSRVAVCF